MATQNPIESEGTYPLPEAQIDRFMLKVVIGYPQHDEELTVVQRQLVDPPELRQALTLEELKALQRAALEIYVDPSLVSYAVDLATVTREPAAHGLPDLAPYISYGASPRGPISLVQGARALALVRGREYALVEDLQALAQGRAPAPARPLLPGSRRGGEPRRPARPGSRGGPRTAARPGAHERGLSHELELRERAPSRHVADPPRARSDAGGPAAGARRLDHAEDGGPARRRLPLEPPRHGLRARDDPAVRARRRRAPDRLERDGTDERAARPGRPRGACARDLARARHVPLDAVRHRRTPQGGRRGRRRDRARPPRDAARKPARDRHLRRDGAARAPADAGPGGTRRAAGDATQRAGRRAATGASAPPRSATASRAWARSRASARSSSSSRTSAGCATGVGRCSSSPAATTSSRSRSATRASRSSRTSASSGSSTRRRDASSAWTRAAAGSASASPRRPRPSARKSPGRSSSVGVRHVVLSTSGDWLRAARRLPPPEPTVTFDWPIVLVGLARLPLLVRALPVVGAAARALAGRVRQPGPAAERRRAAARAAALPPARAAPARARGDDRRRRATARDA